ncbi:MAG: hypothetical protein AVDCRST_MAG01-01-981, partial [uncultured Rubrobacteraceae bacterium]
GEPSCFAGRDGVRRCPCPARAVVQEEPAGRDLVLDRPALRLASGAGSGDASGGGAALGRGAAGDIPAGAAGDHGRRGVRGGRHRGGPVRPDPAQDRRPASPELRDRPARPARAVALRDGAAHEQPDRHPRLRPVGGDRRLLSRHGGQAPRWPAPGEPTPVRRGRRPRRRRRHPARFAPDARPARLRAARRGPDRRRRGLRGAGFRGLARGGRSVQGISAAVVPGGRGDLGHPLRPAGDGRGHGRAVRVADRGRGGPRRGDALPRRGPAGTRHLPDLRPLRLYARAVRPVPAPGLHLRSLLGPRLPATPLQHHRELPGARRIQLRERDGRLLLRRV